MKIDPKMNQEKTAKFKKLFDRTADEIFYDFIGQHGKKVVISIISLLIIIVGITYCWYENNKTNQSIAKEISYIITQKQSGKNCNKAIEACLPKTQTYAISTALRLNSKKIAYRATLLILQDVEHMSTQEWEIYLNNVNNLPYVCQYVHTTSHFKRFSFSAEFLFLKTLYWMQKKHYTKDQMLAFFMTKKLHASIMSSYMLYILAFSTKDKYILDDIFSSADYTISNIPKVILTLAGIKSE